MLLASSPTESVLVALAAILVLGVGAQWLAWRIGLPSILLLLTAGIVVGPWQGWLKPDELFGDLLLPGVSLAVALILYEGGLTLKISELKKVGAVVRNLVTIGAAVTKRAS
jgi:NhaP-type Na+/H+ or K+/H+ antiporter